MSTYATRRIFDLELSLRLEREKSAAMLEALYRALPYIEDMRKCETCLGCYKPGTLPEAEKAVRAAIAKAEAK